MSGEKVFIKQLVDHVKGIVDQNGKNTGLSHFKTSTEPAEINALLPQLSTNTTQVRHSYLLCKLLSTSERNSGRKKGGYRYDSDLQQFAMLMRMLSGPLAYQTLQANLEGALPSLSSTNRYIQASHFHITEGVLRSEELRNYLNERNYPNVVSISEDATRIVGRVQYDSRTNQVVGFTLPTNQKTGMPIPLSFPARNVAEIIQHFASGNVSGFLNVIMAQPVVENAQPFCLLLYGTDSKYTALDVKNRWKYIVDELEKVGVQVLTISSDSDPRYNSAMKDLSNLGMKSKIDWFACGDSIKLPIFIQDLIHLITKLRNLLLRTRWLKKKLPFGNCSVDMMHLYVLLYGFPKDQHQLTESVLNPADRQNFGSAERMCHTRVIEILNRSVEGSEGTALFLKMMRDIMDAFIEPNLEPLERIRCMWFPNFMFRIWRKYIEKHDKYTLKDNFLSLNCYNCIELNAHSMVQLMVHLKAIGRPELFLPQLMGSQQCESIFRQFRSFTSTYSTVINCTLKEAASRLSKIQLQNEVMHNTSKNYVYKRFKTQPQKHESKKFDLPSLEQIYNEIEKCRRDAISMALKFKLIKKRCAKSTECNIKRTDNSHRLKKPQKISTSNRINVNHLNISNIALKDYTGKLKNQNFDDVSPYIGIMRNNGTRAIIKKTSLCWLLQGDCTKLSSDRLLRVQNTTRPQRNGSSNYYSKLKRKASYKR